MVEKTAEAHRDGFISGIRQIYAACAREAFKKHFPDMLGEDASDAEVSCLMGYAVSLDEQNKRERND